MLNEEHSIRSMCQFGMQGAEQTLPETLQRQQMRITVVQADGSKCSKKNISAPAWVPLNKTTRSTYV
jgi:hypothetical protein